MTVDQLDPKTALIIVDLQKGTVRNPLVHPAESVIASCVRLASVFRANGLPVVLINAEGTPPGRTAYGTRELPSDWAELVPELQVAADDLLVTKSGWGAFTGTDLHRQLLDLEVTQVVVAGLATSYGVESTARAAYDLGYHVVVATDAVSDVSADGHDGSLARVYPALGQLSTVDEIAALLADSPWSTQPGPS